MIDKFNNFVAKDKGSGTGAQVLQMRMTQLSFPDCSVVHDRLRESHPDFPEVTERTVYNYVHKVRESHGIPAVKASSRQFAMVPPTEPGEQAQVEAELNLPKSLMHYAKIAADSDF